MRIAIVTEAVPNPGTSGGDAVNWAIIRHAKEAGHVVIAYCLVNRWAIQPSELKARGEILLEMGIEVSFLKIPDSESVDVTLQNSSKHKRLKSLQRIRRTFLPSLADLYPSVTLGPQLAKMLGQANPHSILVFDTGTVAALQHLSLAPRMAIPGDPPHQVEQYRRKLGRARSSVASLNLATTWTRRLTIKRIPTLLLQMLRSYESVGFFGAQHAAWAQAHGIDCQYLRPPVVDAAGSLEQGWSNSEGAKGKPRILIFGNLATTASLTGLYPFAKTTLPILEQMLGPNNFEVHIVGRGTLPDDLEEMLKRPSVRVIGYVEDPRTEFLSSDVCLVPTPYPVGVRTRIVELFSFARCVVTDPASALGLPELRDEVNILLASEGAGWADATMRALGDADLRMSIGEHARKTYDNYYTPKVAVGQIISELERIADMPNESASANMVD